MPTQSKLPFTASKRPALLEIDGNRNAKAAKASPDDFAPLPSPASASKTSSELAAVTRDQAIATLDRLRDGYEDKSGSGYRGAVENEAGCILVQKGTNRQDNGYVQIAPISIGPRTRVGKGETPKQKPKPQNAHRLVVIAYKDDDEIDRLLAGGQASHLCHNPTCIRPSHIVIESKARNEARKLCKGAGVVVRTVMEGREVVLPPNGKCECEGERCINMIEDRVAIFK